MANQQITNIFNVLKSKRGSARPNTGQGFLGQWPDDGEHVCIVDTIEVVSEEKTKFTFMRNEQRVEVPATRIRFWYVLTEDPNSPTEPLRWGGQPFTFPNEVDVIGAEGLRVRHEPGPQIAEDAVDLIVSGGAVLSRGATAERESQQERRKACRGRTLLLARTLDVLAPVCSRALRDEGERGNQRNSIADWPWSPCCIGIAGSRRGRGNSPVPGVSPKAASDPTAPVRWRATLASWFAQSNSCRGPSRSGSGSRSLSALRAVATATAAAWAEGSGCPRPG